MITNENIYQTYVRTICSNCKNRKLDLCEIRRNLNGSLQCASYDKEKEMQGYKEFKGRIVKQSKPLMKNIIR